MTRLTASFVFLTSVLASQDTRKVTEPVIPPSRKGGSENCPRIIILNRCDNFTLYRITLRNSPNFHASYNAGNGFSVWGVEVYSPKRGARNTDGIDPGTSTGHGMSIGSETNGGASTMRVADLSIDGADNDIRI